MHVASRTKMQHTALKINYDKLCISSIVIYLKEHKSMLFSLIYPIIGGRITGHDTGFFLRDFGYFYLKLDCAILHK